MEMEIELESCPLLSRSIELNVTIDVGLGVDFIYETSW